VKNENIEVIHNQKEHHFEITTDGHVAVLDYMLKGEIMIFTHTGVPPAIGGRGLGSKLVKTGLDYARENELRVRSLCWFVGKYMRRHPEYQELLRE
jgi:predicted GNAT family acetyltransferase